ncbi:uncharacterized protein G2W53_017746 [Senna tora]|uniref:Uncharacterized protein n=1 Tax=Senna tora TaxID=362788 RepID=A0A834WKR8_9FABA|nr:uncharacterized protein G2W53_017746 [Senna tora]
MAGFESATCQDLVDCQLSFPASF